MDKITNHLIKLSDNLDKAGNSKCADMVDSLLTGQSITKLAQYVGAIGYVLKQNRAMGNCIRKKRVAQEGPMQDVVMDCLKEYQDGQQYTNNEWTSKYAQVIEQCPEKFENAHMNFFEVVAEANDINDHITKIKETDAALKESGIKDDLMIAAMDDISQIDNLSEEGDADPRPFKVAAPRSQRGFWSRLLSPSWTGRGVQKDTELEMDKILQGISSIARSSQQIKSNIGYLRNNASMLQGYGDVVKLIGELYRH